MTAPVKTTRVEVAGYAAGLVSGLCYGALNIVAKTVITDYNVPPVVVASIALLFGIILLGLLAGPELPRAFQSPKRYVAMYALAGVSGAIGVIFLFSSLERADVVVVSPIIAMNPLFILVMTRMFLRRLERLTLPVVLGTLLVVGGTVLVVAGNSL